MSKRNKVKVGVLLNYGYFQTAQLSIESLLSLRNIGKIAFSHKTRKSHAEAKPLFTLESGSVFLAARFNFKHALELSMKSLFLTAQEPIPSGHDLKDLCGKMKKTLLNKAILNKSFKAWEWLIEEYSVNDKYAPKDAQNELDRYMFGMDGRQLAYTKIHSIKRKDLQIFLRDIKTAKTLFWKMNAEKNLIKMYLEFGLDPEKKVRSKTTICKLKNGRFITKRNHQF